MSFSVFVYIYRKKIAVAFIFKTFFPVFAAFFFLSWTMCCFRLVLGCYFRLCVIHTLMSLNANNRLNLLEGFSRAKSGKMINCGV